MSSSNQYSGRRYLVVGASSGIGLAAAQRIAASGGEVVAIGRSAGKLEQAMTSLPGSNHRMIALDAMDEEQVRSAMSEFKTDGVQFHGAVFSAGMHSVRPAKITRASHYLDAIKSNLLSVTNFIPGFMSVSAPKASLVLISSAAVSRGGTAVSAYTAAKSAVIGLGRALAVELAPRIRVNVVIPGVVMTPMTEAFFASIGDAAVQDVIKRHPLGLGNADHVASAITFLLSDDAAWITGADIVVDGGFSVAG